MTTKIKNSMADMASIAADSTMTAMVDGRLPAISSQAEAEAGSDNAKMMTALRTAQAIQKNNITLGTVQATTSGSSITFSSIPSWVKRITLSLNAVSSTSAAGYSAQIGTSGGLQATGYSGSYAAFGSGSYPSVTNTSSSFPVGSIGTVSDSISGTVVLTLLDASNGIWACNATTGRVTSAVVFVTAGTKSLAGVLDRVSLAIDTGTFDAGSVNIAYE